MLSPDHPALQGQQAPRHRHSDNVPRQRNVQRNRVDAVRQSTDDRLQRQ